SRSGDQDSLEASPSVAGSKQSAQTLRPVEYPQVSFCESSHSFDLSVGAMFRPVPGAASVRGAEQFARCEERVALYVQAQPATPPGCESEDSGACRARTTSPCRKSSVAPGSPAVFGISDTQGLNGRVIGVFVRDQYPARLGVQEENVRKIVMLWVGRRDVFPICASVGGDQDTMRGQHPSDGRHQQLHLR